MKTFFTRKDLIQSMSDRNPCCCRYFPLLLQHFEALEKALGSQQENFTLSEHGPIIMIDPGDDLHNLQSGFLSESLFVTVPEEVVVRTVDGDVLYQILVLCNNEFMPTFFIPKEIMDRYPEAEAYLARWL